MFPYGRVRIRPVGLLYAYDVALLQPFFYDALLPCRSIRIRINKPA